MSCIAGDNDEGKELLSQLNLLVDFDGSRAQSDGPFFKL